MFLPEWELMGLPGWISMKTEEASGYWGSLFSRKFLSNYNRFGTLTPDLEFVIFRQFKKT